MYPRQRLYRAVKWAHGLSVFTLAFVVFAFCVCPSTTTVISSAAAMKAGRESRPPPDSQQREWADWNERQRSAGVAAYDATGKTFQVVALCIGIPTTVLLVVVCILLYRVRRWIERGV